MTGTNFITRGELGMLLALALLGAIHTTVVSDSVAGAWQITGEVSGTPVRTICTIKQAGTELSGSCTSETNTPMPITGAVKEGKVTFQYVVDYQGQALTIAYSGTLISPAQIKGSIEVKPLAVPGTFSAVPVPPKP